MTATANGVQITVPDIGDFEDVPVIEVHVSPGDKLNAEDPVITLESDKATMDVPVPSSGTVTEVLVKVGDSVSRGTPILYLAPGDGAVTSPPSLVEQQEPAPAQAAQVATAVAAPVAAPPAVSTPSAGAAPPGAHAGPSVRRMARELGVDLSAVTASGPKGRITKDDLLSFLQGPAQPAAAAAAAQGSGIPEIPAQDFGKFGPVETRELSRIKKVSGPFLHRSWLNVPHVTQNDEADITALDAYRKELDTAAKTEKEPYRVTLLAFLVKAAVAALKKFPEFNSSLTPEKDALILKRYYNIGIAVDTPDGLVVPVVKDADRKGIVELSREFGDDLGQGPRRQARPVRHAGRHVHHLQPRRHRRHQLHPDRQRARGGDPRRGALRDEARVGRQRVRTAADVAAVAVLRPPRHRRRTGRPVRPAPVLPARRRPPPPPLRSSRTRTFERSAAMAAQEIRIPDIGDFHDVPIIEIHVAPGDTVAAEDPLVTLESDKATLDVPAPVAGTVVTIAVEVGHTVSEGSVIATLDVVGQASGEPPADRLTSTPATPATTSDPGAAAELTAPAGYGSSAAPPSPQTATHPAALAPYTGPKGDVHAEVLVLGAGPGGYTAAFRAADLGKQVVLVDSRGPLGGVCLNIGCIPSKALLHAAKVIAETKEMSAHGLSFGEPTIDLDALRDWKDGVVGRLTGGLAGLAKQRKVTTIVGTGTFTGPNMLAVTGADGTASTVSFDAAIIAAGSEPVQLPFVPRDDPRVIDSTGALALERIPQRLLVLGGGIIGLEMATVYHELGSSVSVVELMDQLIPGVDKDIVTPLARRIGKQYAAIWLGTKVTDVQAGPDGLTVIVRRVRQQGPVQGLRDGHVRRRARRRRASAERDASSGRTRRACSSTTAGSSPSTSSSAPTSGTSSPSATSSGSPCSRTRPCTKARSPPRTPRGRRATSTPPSSRRWPTPTPRSPGSASPRTRPRPPG